MTLPAPIPPSRPLPLMHYPPQCSYQLRAVPLSPRVLGVPCCPSAHSLQTQSLARSSSCPAATSFAFQSYANTKQSPCISRHPPTFSAVSNARPLDAYSKEQFVVLSPTKPSSDPDKPSLTLYIEGRIPFFLTTLVFIPLNVRVLFSHAL